MLKYTDFFELINNDGPVAALFMTYGFDAGLFEHHILPSFLGVIDNPKDNELRFRNQIALRLKEIPVAILSDARQFQGGRTFLYDHIAVTAETFHPKCYMLLFKDFLRVIISSGNLTRSGLCYNAETTWYEDIYPNSTSTITNELSNILIWMQNNYELDKIDAINEMIKYLSNIKHKDGFPKLISTVNNNSVYTQIFNEMITDSSQCKKINIISPFFENDRDKAIENSLLISFYERITKTYPKISFRIFFQAIYDNANKYYKVNAPEKIFQGLVNKSRSVILNIIPKDWELEDENTIPRNLHAKLIIIEFVSGYQLRLSGSINFTNNAMTSSFSSLHNIEIGILEYSKTKFWLPDCKKIDISMMKFIEKTIVETSIVCFIKKAVLDGLNLMITFDLDKMVVPCRIIYNENIILEISDKSEELLISNFHLKQSQDLEINYDSYSFFFPIIILNKEDRITEDLKLDFSLYTKDIIDFLAGKYKSISEIGRSKQIGNGGDIDLSKTIYFRQNLQRYFKAMAALKQGLEQPYYSELAFNNYIRNPIGLKKLINMILVEYKDNIANDEETFLFIIEILNITENLEYKEDRIDNIFKVNVLTEVMKDAKDILKTIINSSKGKVKNQYLVMKNYYGLDV